MGLPRVRFVWVFMGIEVWVGFTKGAVILGVHGDWSVGWVN